MHHTEIIRCRIKNGRQFILGKIDLLVEDLMILKRDIKRGAVRGFSSQSSPGDIVAKIGEIAGLTEAFDVVDADRQIADMTTEQSQVFDSIEDRNNFVAWFRDKMDESGFAFSDHDRHRWEVAMEGW